MNNLIPRAAPVLALWLAALVGAQAQGRTSPPTAATAALPYQSAFADYKPWQDTRPGDWRALNDAVKGDSMSGMDMSGMKGMGDMKDMRGMRGMRGMGGMAGHDLQTPDAARAPDDGQARAPARAASMPAMPAMPAMPGMSAPAGHAMKGGRP